MNICAPPYSVRRGAFFLQTELSRPPKGAGSSYPVYPGLESVRQSLFGYFILIHGLNVYKKWVAKSFVYGFCSEFFVVTLGVNQDRRSQQMPQPLLLLLQPQSQSLLLWLQQQNQIMSRMMIIQQQLLLPLPKLNPHIVNTLLKK